jgi:hypothetical protein
MREFLDHYLGGLILVLSGIGIMAFGVWDKIPGSARDMVVTTGIAIMMVGAGVFNVERKSARVESKVDAALTSQVAIANQVAENTVITAEAADAAKAAAEVAVVAAAENVAARERVR